MIDGGYYIKARKIQESEIAHAPPHVREIWDWLIKECNHKDQKSHGILIKRGQCMRSYKDIQKGLHWMIGWRKKTYSKNHCETSMNWLKNHTMVHTTKTTRGMIVTVINYDTYQDPKNYEPDNEPYRRHTLNIQTSDTINKNDKNVKNEIKDLAPKKGAKWQEATPMDLKQFVDWCRKSKDSHVQIIGEWADELNQSFKFTGYETYGEWHRLFFKQNLKAARDLSPSWKQENGRTRMSEATALLVSESKNGHWKTGNLSTLIKYMPKV